MTKHTDVLTAFTHDFTHANGIEITDRRASYAQQYDLGTRAPVRRDTAAVDSFSKAVKSLYREKLGCGEIGMIGLLDREDGSQLISVHSSEQPLLRTEVSDTQCQGELGNPDILMSIEYSKNTGVARTQIKGGPRYHDLLAKAFTHHLLGVEFEAQQIKLPTLNLSALKLGFQVPQATADGFIALQVKSLTLINPNTDLKAKFTALDSNEQLCVTELIAKGFPNDNPLDSHWSVNAAAINLHYAPTPGTQINPVITVEVTRRGRLNLNKFDEKLRAQLERYLVQIGVMQAHHTLSMTETADAHFA